MRHRPPTTSLPLLALLVALTLLAHDAVMVAGPHDSGMHADHHDDMPADETACGELVAARTNDAGPGPDMAVAPGGEVASLSLLAIEHVPCIGDAVDTSGATQRAMLQIWLN